MNYVNEQYVILPYVFPLPEILKYPDLMVYIAIRSFEGERGCFPCYETIAERAGCSRDYVIDAVKRLEEVKMLKCKRSDKIKKVNRYSFTRYKYFERIPYKFFKLNSRLTMYEMGIMLCLRHVLKGGQQHITVKSLADIFGLTRKKLDRQLSSLIKKGYVQKIHSALGKKYVFTTKFSWIYDYTREKPGAIKVNNNNPIIIV